MQSNHGKRVLLISVLFAASIFSNPLAAETGGPDEKKVAIVNGTAITQTDLDNELIVIKKRFMEQGRAITDAQLKGISGAVIETLINRELLFQQSQKMGIAVKDEEVLNQLIKMKEGFPSEAEYQKKISEMNMSESAIKAQINRALVIRELINKEVADKVEVSDEEAKEFYDSRPQDFKQPEEVNARHILIKVDQNAEETEKAKSKKEIKEIQKKLKNGEDFADLAKEYSQGPSGPKGGALGYFKRGQMVKPFEDAAFALDTNEVSDIVETTFGYHLIKVVDKKPESTIDYEVIKPRIVEYLKQEKTKKEMGLYVEKLRNDAEIKLL
jgi:peptidyl-prolyl cis-trans isomerase C